MNRAQVAILVAGACLAGGASLGWGRPWVALGFFMGALIAFVTFFVLRTTVALVASGFLTPERGTRMMFLLVLLKLPLLVLAAYLIVLLPIDGMAASLAAIVLVYSVLVWRVATSARAPVSPER